MIVKSHELAVLEQASRMLAEAHSLGEIKSIRDKAEAARNYVRAANLGLELQNRAAELKIRAERKAGTFLRKLKLRGGDRRSNRHDAGLKLEDLGISCDQSRRWQYIASVSEMEFAQYLKTMNDQHREVTSAGLLRTAAKPKAQDNARGKRSRQITKGGQDASEPQEIIAELLNHFQLLTNVLKPVCEGENFGLVRAERRIIGRLIRDMTDLIGQLKEEWPH